MDPRPYPGRGSRLSLRESPDAKSPREGRVSALPGPTSLWFEKLGEVGFSFSYKLWTDARNGPPPGWAGWGKWGGIGRKGLWVPLPKAFPLGGRWPGAAGTDEGATGYPTEQKKTGVQAAGRWALVFYKERLRSHRPLISLLRRQLPPKGKPLDVAGQPPLSHLYETTPPARPAGGRAAPCVGCRAAGQDTKRAGYPEGYPKPEWGVQRGETLPSGVLSSISHRRNGGRRQAPPGALRPEAASEARPERSVTHGGQAPGPTGQGLTCAASKWYGVPTPPRPRHKKGPGQPARSFLLRYCRVG